MNIIDIRIYDCEVFAHDWIVIFKGLEPGAKHTVIHNDNLKLKKYIQEGHILGGFNSKHYDDWIIQAIIHGADPTTVKRLNDFIIMEGHKGWEFPFLQFKKKEFDSFDLRDDLPNSLSLKAIEGNSGANIVESSVPFDIQRPLTEEELKSTIRYCKTDVDNTIALYHQRQDYMESKKTVARLKEMDEVEAIGLTNAKLTARFLDAKKMTHDDENVYDPPEELRIGKYAKTLDFFRDPVEFTLADLKEKLEKAPSVVKKRSLTRQIAELEESRNRYDCELEMDVAGVPHKFAWGGIHGAKTNYLQRADPSYRIVTIDVGSYYPSLMLEYNYISRNIPSAEGYAEIYHKRMKAKHDGDGATADALKLVLNTCYGAMKNQWNELYDPRNASAICITGQLFLTDLIDKLEDVQGFELIQSNTDGIIIRFPIYVEDQIVAKVAEWEKRTRMNMEYTIIHAIAQKDVNNYVMKSGETYLYQNGQKVVTKEDKGKVKSKGGYVSLFGGGDFRNNSLVVLHKALVDYFMDDIPVEDTIRNCKEVKDFQMIAKTGSSYDGTYHEVDGQKVQVQKVNRVYATKNKTYGTIYKAKANGRADKIAELPLHCIIDNEGRMNIKDIDKDFYIAMAKKRITDYIGKHKKLLKSEEKKMAENKMNIYQKINKVRMEFLQADVKKSGVNRFAEYKYFELADIVPTALKLCDKYGLTTVVEFHEDYAVMHLHDADEKDGYVFFRSPMRNLVVKGMNEIQALGAVETYQRRYLYMAFLDIVEQDAIDGTAGKPEEPEKAAPKQSNRPASPAKREEVKKELIDENGEASEIQIKSIKAGLKKLREKNDTYEPYIKEVLKKIKAGIQKKGAEDILIAIGNKIEE